MKKRKIILHVGQSKAGSTSIQNYLEKQYDRLTQRGVLFPTSVLSRNNAFDADRTAGHRQLLADIKAGDVSAFEDEVAKHDPHTIILSIEGMFSDLPDDTLKALGDFLGDADIELVAVLRPQLEWLRSRYVEDVMTGFKSAFTDSFAAFAHQAHDSRAISYRRRLTFLAEVFGATKVTAIAMVQHKKALVPRFMEAIGLPVTDVDLASNMHSNRRLKHAALLEAKRRLNAITRVLGTTERLDLERCLADKAAAIDVDVGGRGGDVRQWKVPLSQEELDGLASGNRALHREGVIDALLPIGDLGTADCGLDQVGLTDMEQLFAFGLSKAIEIAARPAQREIDRSSPLALSQEESAGILSAMLKCRVSLHLNSPATALLASCIDGGLVNLLMYPGAASYRLSAELEMLHTASPLTGAVVRSEEVSHLTRCIDRLGLLEPDLIVVGGKTTPSPLKMAIDRVRPLILIVLDEAVDRVSGLSLVGYDAHRVGNCLMMRRQDS